MTYTHLTQDERYQIYILKKAGHDQSAIAEIMERSKSTISRELKRNSGSRGYRPKQAQALSLARQSTDNVATVHADTWAFADAKLVLHWSPEQINGYLRVNNQPGVSHESIYKRIYADKRLGGTLHSTLIMVRSLHSMNALLGTSKQSIILRILIALGRVARMRI